MLRGIATGRPALRVLVAGMGVLLAGCAELDTQTVDEPSHPLTVEATDYAFLGVPGQVRSGRQILELINSGRDNHLLSIWHLTGAHRAAELGDLLARDPNAVLPPWVQETSGFAGPLSPGTRGRTAEAARAGSWTRLGSEGTYAVVCTLRTADGRSHAGLGMVSEFEVVTRPPAEGTAPETRQRIDMEVIFKDGVLSVADPTDERDDRPRPRSGPAAGDRTIEFHNLGDRPVQKFMVAELLPGVTPARFIDGVRNGRLSASGTLLGGAAALVQSGDRRQIALRAADDHRDRYTATVEPLENGRAYVVFTWVDGADRPVYTSFRT